MFSRFFSFFSENDSEESEYQNQQIIPNAFISPNSLIQDAEILERNDSAEEIPSALCCMITKKIFREPVITINKPNITVEKDVFLNPQKYPIKVRSYNAYSPMTQYVPNEAILKEVERYLIKYPDKDTIEFRFPEYPVMLETEKNKKWSPGTVQCVKYMAVFCCIGGFIIAIVIMSIMLPSCEHIGLYNSFPQALNFTNTISGDDYSACTLSPDPLIYPNNTAHIYRPYTDYCTFYLNDGITLRTTAFAVKVEGQTNDGLKMRAVHSKNEKCLWTLMEDEPQNVLRF